MPRSITLAACLNPRGAEGAAPTGSEPVERIYLRIIWLLASNHAQVTVTALTGYSTRQIRAITKRYGDGGPEA